MSGYLKPILTALKELVKSGELEWFAISVKLKGGTTLALHSKHAPDRPKGMGR